MRLCLPQPGSVETGMADLKDAALIREVHVYGQSLAVGSETGSATQHSGLGTKLLIEAEIIARAHDYKALAVISAIGTRKYYLERGFERGEMYLVRKLDPPN